MDGNLQLKVTLDSSGVVQKIEQIQGAEKELKRTTDDTSKSFSGFQSAVIALNQAIQLAETAFRYFSAGVRETLDLVSEGDKIAGLSAGFKDLAREAGVTSDVFLGELQDATNGMIDNFELMRNANKALMAELSPDQILQLASAAETLGDAAGKDAAEAFTILTESVSKANGKMLTQLNIQAKGITDSGELIDKIIDKANKLGGAGSTAGDALDQISVTLKNARQELSKAVTENEDLIRSLELLNKNLKEAVDSGFVEFLADIAAAMVGIPVDIFNDIAAFFDSRHQMHVEAIRREYEQLNPELLATYDMLRKLSTEIADQAALDTMNQGLESLAQALADAEVGGRLLERMLGDLSHLSEAAAKSLAKIEAPVIEIKGSGKGIGSAILDSIKETFNSPDFQQSMGQGIGNVISSSISAAFGGDKGAIKDSLRGLGGQAGADLGAAAGMAIGGPLGAGIGASIGQAAGDALGKGVYDAFDHAFGGGNDPETKARKSVDQFFADAFSASRLQVIIGDQLKQITDMNFDSSYTGGLFGDVADDTANAFLGVGTAIHELLGLTEDIAPQIGSVLSNNIGGSLNNLQAVIGALGISFDQLKDLIVTSFNKGQVSFLQAQSQLIEINKLAEQGIPDAFGAAGEAVDNFFKAGAKGGAFAIDAMRDVAAEMKEAGQTAFTQIAATGSTTTEQMAAFIQALADHGIDSAEELAAATTETLIAIGSQLEAQGFLVDQGSKVDELINKLTSIPDKIESDIVLNVKVNGSSQDKQIAQEALGGPGLQ